MNPNIDSIAKINNVCLVILTLIASTFALIYTKIIMIPFVFAIFLYSVVSSAIRLIKRKLKLSKKMAVLATLILILGTAFITIFFVSNSVQNFAQGAHEYNAKIITFVDWATQFADRFGYELNAETIKTKITQLPLFDIAQVVTGDLFTLIGNFILVLVLSLFLAFGNRNTKHNNKIVADIQYNTSRYIFVKLCASLAAGILISIVLLACKVQLAFTLAVLAFLLNFIPSIGAVIAIILPLPIILLQYGFGWQFTVALSSITLIQIAIGSFVEPKFIGTSMDLHPITVLVALLFWGLIWGIPGMFLSIPITAALKIIFNEIETLKPLSELLAGRF